MTTEPTDYDKAKAFLEEQHKGEHDSFEPSPKVAGAYYSPTDSWEDGVDKKLKYLQMEVTISGVGALIAIGAVLLLGRLVVKTVTTQGQIIQLLQQAGMAPIAPEKQSTNSDGSTVVNPSPTVPATAPTPSGVKYNQPEKVITDAPPIDHELLEDLKRSMGEDINGDSSPQ